jgi:large subunit ribosomal protein L6
MSRIAKKPVEVPAGVEVLFSDQLLKVKGPKGHLEQLINKSVDFEHQGTVVNVKVRENNSTSWMHAGTARSLLNGMIQGVSKGFEKKLNLVGVGFRVQVQGKKLTFSLGYSHPIEYTLPEGITAEAPSLTELIIKGLDRQLLGQVAAEIREFRPPEVYKGKGVRYASEKIQLKEAKKK